MELLIVILYLLPTLVLMAYSGVQLSLVWSYWRGRRGEAEGRRQKANTPYTLHHTSLPTVTVQLPIYNERYVIERLLEAVAALDYPREYLEIQILDDSTDETTELITSKLTYLCQQGIDIQHLRRASREGFKAGALAYGLPKAKGELIAIFDADFVPEPDFLIQTVSYFDNPKIGVVQTRWGHLNADYSLLTRMQAFGLDGHFVVEQGGRNAAGHFINFNGTAGVWRKTCIEEAGGWSADTLTEDLDLSYRAQLKGWQFVYLEEVETPAELPATMPALKSQQYRWMKGAAECARKNLSNALQTNALKFSTKVHASFHLLNSGVFLAVLLMAIMSVPALWVTKEHREYDALLGIFRMSQISVIVLIGFYVTTHFRKKTFLEILWQLPIFLTVVMGLSLHNSVAVLEGYLGRKTAFVRTPKWGIVQQKGSWQEKKYLLKSLNPLTFIELLLVVYFVVGVALGIYWEAYSMLILHTMLALGFGFVSFYSVKHSMG